jgi:catechol 2,3-dioxygenase-like lactoylglutathione lyase family enzyme
MFGSNAIHANFSVDDLSAARDFYVDTLGFKPVKELEGQLVLEAGRGTKVNIYEKENHQPWDSTVLGIEVEDVDMAVKQLLSVGIEMAKLPGTDEDGIIRDPDLGDAAWFQDPAGNWICISNIV